MRNDTNYHNGQACGSTNKIEDGIPVNDKSNIYKQIRINSNFNLFQR